VRCDFWGDRQRSPFFLPKSALSILLRPFKRSAVNQTARQNSVRSQAFRLMFKHSVISIYSQLHQITLQFVFFDLILNPVLLDDEKR
jgi:hypothetical protein